MAYNIKGITVKINGDASDLQKEINKIKSQTSGLDKTMSSLKSSMKGLNGSNWQSFSKYQDLVQTKMKSLTTQVQQYQKTLNAMPKTYKEWSNQVQTLTTRNKELNKNLSLGKGNIEAQTNELESNKKVLKSLGTDWDAYQQKLVSTEATMLTTQNQLKKLSTELVAHSKSAQQLYYSLDYVSSGLNKFAEATKYVSLGSAVALAGAAAAAISFEDAWAGVTKTVEGTPEQLEAVNDGLKDLALNTASSYEDIAHFGELAGQMGIATDAVVDFTKTITMLGDTTNLVGDEAAQEIAKFSNIMVDSSQKTNDYYSRLGSTIVDLGNNFATTESDIMQMSMRLATAGRQVGFSSQEVLALATALSSMGIEAAAGGGSISKMLKQIETAVATGSEKLTAYAEVAGMSAQEFAQAWEVDAAGAFGKFIEGLGRSENITKTLNDLEIKEVRMSNAMGALAQNTEMYTSALDMANKAWDDNTAMVNEAEKRYATLKSQLIQTWEAIKQAGNELGQALTPALTKIAKAVKNVAVWFANLDDGTQQLIANVLLFTAALSPASKALSLVTRGGANLIKSGSKLVGLFQGVSSAAEDLSIMTAGSASGVASLAKGFLASAGPAAAIAVGIGAVVGVTATAISRFEELNQEVLDNIRANDANFVAAERMIEGYSEFTDTIQKLKDANTDLSAEYQAETQQADSLWKLIKQLNSEEELSTTQKQLLAEYVEQLNALYPELGLQIDSATGKLKTGTDETYNNIQAIDQRIQALQDEAKAEVESQTIKNNAKMLAESTAQYEQQKMTLEDLTETHQKLSEELAKNWTAEGQAEVEEYANQIEKLRGQMVETIDTMMEAKKQSFVDQNFLETGSYEVLGETLKTQLIEMVNTAKETGIEIPKELSKGIENGSVSVQQAASLMASLDTLNSMVDDAGKIGGLVPSELASSMIANEPTVQSATDKLNKIITFSNLISQAQLEGQEISESVALGLAEQAGLSGEEAQKLVDGVMEELGKGPEEAGDKGDKTGKSYNEKVASNAGGSKESGKKLKDGTVEGLNDNGQAGGKGNKSAQDYINALNSYREQAKASGKGLGDKNVEGLGSSDYYGAGQSGANSANAGFASVSGYWTGKSLGDSIKSGLSNAFSTIGGIVAYGAEIVKSMFRSDSLMENASWEDMIPQNTMALRSTPQMFMRADQPYMPNDNEEIDTLSYASQAYKTPPINYASINSGMEDVARAIGDLEFKIILEPQELDGEVVSRQVVKRVKLKQMLTNYGKGVN